MIKTNERGLEVNECVVLSIFPGKVNGAGAVVHYAETAEKKLQVIIIKVSSNRKDII